LRRSPLRRNRQWILEARGCGRHGPSACCHGRERDDRGAYQIHGVVLTREEGPDRRVLGG
jgi:hypothetical protein